MNKKQKRITELKVLESKLIDIIIASSREQENHKYSEKYMKKLCSLFHQVNLHIVELMYRD